MSLLPLDQPNVCRQAGVCWLRRCKCNKLKSFELAVPWATWRPVSCPHVSAYDVLLADDAMRTELHSVVLSSCRTLTNGVVWSTEQCGETPMHEVWQGPGAECAGAVCAVTTRVFLSETIHRNFTTSAQQLFNRACQMIQLLRRLGILVWEHARVNSAECRKTLTSWGRLCTRKSNAAAASVLPEVEIE